MVLSFITGPSTTPSIPFLDYRRWRIPRAKTVAIGSRSQPRPLGDGIPTLQLMILNGRLYSNPVQLNELFFPKPIKGIKQIRLFARLGPLTFIIVIDTLKLSCLTYKYVDDTTMYEFLASGQSSQFDNYLAQLSQWSLSNHGS